MRKETFLSGLVVVLVAGIGLAGCQVEAPVLQSGQAKELLDSWTNNGKKLIEMAEDFPEDKYGYKASEEIRPFGEFIRHIAAVNFRYIRMEQGQEYDPAEFAPENFTSRADLAALIKRSYDEGAALLEQAGDAQMVEAVKNPYGDYTNSRFAFWMQAVEHAAEHYGNLVIYYRLNGLVPPASRGN